MPLQMQMLHCISQTSSEGGESEFVDGFHVARQIQEHHSEEFKTLTTTCLDFYDMGRERVEFFQMSKHPTIRWIQSDSGSIC